MNMVFSSVLTTAVHLSKIIIGFVFLKLIAVYLGVEGMGMLGHFMSAVTILSLMAGGGVVNGVIKYVAEYKYRPRRLLQFILATKTYSLICCSFVFMFGVVFADSVAGYIFKSSQYSWIVVFLAFAQFGFAFTNLVTGTANGLGDIQTYAKIQICGNLLVLPLTWLLIRNYGVSGAALSIILFFLLYSAPAFLFYKRSKFWNKVTGLKLVWGDCRSLFSYTAMALVGAVSVPLVEIVVRDAIISDVGNVAAGIWQASIKLSGAYMGFFIVFLTVYFMPMISAEGNRHTIGVTVFKFVKIVMFLFSIGGAFFYLMRGWLIPLLLTSSFVELESLIKYQLLGDFFRVSAYVIGFVVIAKAALKIYVIGEISQGVLFCTLSLLFLNSGLGVKGVFIAHLIMNAIYFLCAVVGIFIYLKDVGRVHVDC